MFGVKADGRASLGFRGCPLSKATIMDPLARAGLPIASLHASCLSPACPVHSTRPSLQLGDLPSSKIPGTHIRDGTLDLVTRKQSSCQDGNLQAPFCSESSPCGATSNTRLVGRDVQADLDPFIGMTQVTEASPQSSKLFKLGRGFSRGCRKCFLSRP